MTMTWSVEQDLAQICDQAADDLAHLDGKRLFITGGTGFIGTWLLKTLKLAMAARGLKANVHVLTRSVSSFAAKSPELANFEGFEWHEGDARSFTLPAGLNLDLVFHGATDASAQLNAENPMLMFDTIVEGTRHILDLAKSAGAKRFLMLSSGAVYGQQPWEMERVPETWMGAPDCTNPVQTYAEAKRAAELITAIYNRDTSLNVTTARIFAVLGPLLPLGTHFAAGNFLADALAGRPAVVKGDGLAVRSYIYPTDLIRFLLAIWTRGAPGEAYNVGSDQGISIGELAARISKLVGTGEYEILGKADAGWNPGRYVPDMEKLKSSLSIAPQVDLDRAILNTAKYYAAAIESQSAF